MAVEAWSNRNLMNDMDDDDDDDDAPLVFKRSSTSSRQNHSNSEAKKPSSQKLDGQSRRRASDVRSPNGESSSAPKVKPVPSFKPSATKSPPPSLKASNSSSKGPPTTKSPPPSLKASTSSSKGPTATKSPPPSLKASISSSKGPSATKSPPPSLKASTSSSKGPTEKPPEASPRMTSSMADQKKQLKQGKSGLSVKEEKKPSYEPAVRAHDDSEDSEDEKPLSARMKDKSNNASRVPVGSTSGQKPRVPKHEGSDDEEAPLSMFRMAIAGTSTSKVNDSDDEKPLSLKMKQNGSSLPKNSSTVSNKRPPGDVKSPGQSSIKKPKLSDASIPTTSKQASVKAEPKAEEDDDHVPISQRIKQTTSANKSSSGKKINTSASSSVKKVNKISKKIVKKTKYSTSYKVPPSSGEGQKWTTLVHSGVIFPPPYKPHGVKMNYKGKPVNLTPEQEEVATMYAVMLETEYMSKTQFKENFFNDWKKILGKNHVIQNLEECDFTPIYEWHQQEKEKKKQMTTEEKKAVKEEKMQLEEKYMWAIVDGVKEKVGNFRVEPPGLFRGRGEHPKMGKLKKRIRPQDIVINIGKDAPIPECPIAGESWKEIRHDNTVTWLAYWNDPINPKEFKYVFLAASSTLKGQSDKEKYEKARLLKDYVEGIRATYTKNFTNKDPMKQQIAVATYLIDKLALRAGNEKDDDEADTVGCCTLKVENVEPVPPDILKFDFLGKDSIRYQNEVPVEQAVFKAIQQFRRGKKPGDDLFDRLDTSKLNSHLKELMPGLTAKVFRTYNASITLDQMLSKETKGGDMAEKIVVYNHANKEVAIICNHQRTVSKSHSAQMTRLNEKIEELKGVLEELQTDLGRAKKGKPPLKNADGKPKRNLNPEALEKKIAQTNAKIEKMERDKHSKEDLKTVALGTSKINYLDPRITVAWCKRHEVPIEKMFNKSLLAKFSWAMDVDPSFRF